MIDQLNWVLDQKQIPMNNIERMVLVCLIVKSEGQYPFQISVQSMGKACGTSFEFTRNAITWLEDNLLIERNAILIPHPTKHDTPLRGGPRMRAYEYTVTLPTEK